MHNRKYNILFAAAEVVPFAKTGGLADVAGSLPKALIDMGHDVRIVMPKYKKVTGETQYVCDFPVQFDWRKETCVVRQAYIDSAADYDAKRVPVYFIDNYHYFDREYLYCYYDEAERFAFFCRAVIDMLPKIGFKPDIIHCNDWHTGPVCMLLNEQYKHEQFYKDIASVYTVHNLEYQGNYPPDTVKLFNLNPGIFTSEKMEFFGTFSFMKAGLLYADIINTVSETYAREIQTQEYGERFDGLLRKRKNDLFGIVNGISYDEFNPMTDSRIFANYSVDDMSGKSVNKAGLQREIGLSERNVPLMGIVSRLTKQKGIDLVIEKIDEIMAYDVQFVILGSGDDYYEEFFKNLQQKYPEKVGTYIGFNEILAQKIYAGCDIFLMPSKFEPCGLGQLISLRYGSVPIVRATGGLEDTIINFDIDTEEGNGFTFKEYSADSFMQALQSAIILYELNPNKWMQLVRKGMGKDFSWHTSAEKYDGIYRLAIEKNKW